MTDLNRTEIIKLFVDGQEVGTGQDVVISNFPLINNNNRLLDQRDHIQFRIKSTGNNIPAGSTIKINYYATGSLGFVGTETITLPEITKDLVPTAVYAFSSNYTTIADYFTLEITLKKGTAYKAYIDCIVKKKIDSAAETNQPSPTMSTPGYLGQVIFDTNGDKWELIRIDGSDYYWYRDGDYSYITDPSISSTTGSLIVGGGVGINEDIHANGVEITVDGKNKHRVFLSNNTAPIFRMQTYYWNGATFIIDSTIGFGYEAGRSNSGGFSTLFGYGSGQYNTGINASFSGHLSGQNNSGDNACGYGRRSLYENTGSSPIGFGVNAMYQNVGSSVISGGVNANFYNNWDSRLTLGHYSSPVFNEDALSAKSFSDTEITANTITFPTAHGFGVVGKKVNLRYKTTAGTPPTGLVNNTIYLFTVTSTTVLTLSGIGTNASTDFEGTLTNSVDVSNSITLGNNVSPSKKNQITLGPPSITETILRVPSQRYADNAAALAAGLKVGTVYKSTTKGLDIVE